ncbi:MAG: hypothetical protein J6X81_01795 [Muribaculaceae bacterium]|nr:hypothetical protein [Muribaculaceae bacterium]
MKVFLFNPENDLALANGTPFYTPTPMAKQLRKDLRMLPVWYAPKGSCVLGEEQDCEWFEGINKKYHLDLQLVTKKELTVRNDVQFCPWGWSAALKTELLKMGVAPESLPTDSQLDTWRNLAHRRTTIVFHRRLHEILGDRISATSPVELATIDEVIRYARENPYSFFKQPFSGSGRGVYRVFDGPSKSMEQWCVGALRDQGSILCERGYAKLMDFAAEFHCEHGDAKFMGYSVFKTDFHNQFQYGLVADQRLLESMLRGQVPDFAAVIMAVRDVVAEQIAPVYEGYVGVDMMLYEEMPGEVRVNPCVEINLRATMGVVTCGIAQRMSFTGTKLAEFRIEQAAGGIVQNALTPIYEKTRFAARI